MKISVVVPAYNEEVLLPACLESIFRSLAFAGVPPAEAEVIVVNNASTDRTRKVALSFPGVRVVDEAHKGLTRAKQAGFLAARGEILAHPDADTIMPKEWISRVLAAFAHDPSLVCISGTYYYFDLPRSSRALVYAWYGVAFASHLVIRDVLQVGAMVQGGNYAVRRSALEAVGGYDTSIEFYGEDFDIGRRLSKVGKVVFTWRRLPMPSSGRRLAQEGIVMTGLRYGVNNMSSTFLKRPLAHKYTDIRHTSERA